jgi:non-ribosomal peptide synthetase component E (peptide arylation enzyme)
MAQERNLLHPKLALAKLGIQPMVSKFLQNQTEFFMFFFTLEVNQYIFDEQYDKLVQILHKDLVHQIHKIGHSIG